MRNNTILFSWYDHADGQGHSSVGTGIYTRGDCAFEADNNIIGYCDEHGIFTSSEPRRVKVTNNVFMKNLFAHMANGRELVIDDKTWSHWQDAGFIDAKGNRNDLDPKLPFDKKWMEVYFGRTMSIPGKVTMDDWNKTRELLGLPVVAEGGKAAESYCRAYPWREALKLVPQNPDCKAGARPIELEVHFNPNPAPGQGEQDLPDRRVAAVPERDRRARREGRGGRRHARRDQGVDDLQLPSGRLLAEMAALDLYGPAGRGESGLPCMGYFKKGTRLEKAIKKADEKAKWTIRGIAKKGPTFNRGLMVIEC